MFFCIAPAPDDRFPNSRMMGRWHVSFDDGWHQQPNQISKGYRYQHLDHGNWLEIAWQDGSISLSHDKSRAFPLWWHEQSRALTNLLGQGQLIWSNEIVNLSDDIAIRKRDIIGEICTQPLSIDEACIAISDNLIAKARCLDELKEPIKLFVTGGIDTITLKSLLDCSYVPYKWIDCEHFEYDAFTNRNFEQLSAQHWAYQQIHHWRQPSWLATGSCGDEFMFRGPYLIAQWAAWNGINIVDLIDKSDGYHKWYFSKDTNRQIFMRHYQKRHEIRDRFPDYAALCHHLLDCNANDHQHWHLGNTLTWTPFKDLAITKIMLRLDPEILVSQILDAAVSKEIVKRLHAPNLDLLSRYKNINMRQNLPVS